MQEITLNLNTILIIPMFLCDDNLALLSGVVLFGYHCSVKGISAFKSVSVGATDEDIKRWVLLILPNLVNHVTAFR